MFVCPECSRSIDTDKERILYGYDGLRVCRECSEVQEQFHIDRIESTPHGPKISKFYENLSIDKQRDAFIQFVYLLFDNKLNPAIFRLEKQYLKKGYTYIGMVRALEFFYHVKKNNLNKAKNNIGIIPYVYEDAQKYYNLQADKALTLAKKWESQFVTATATTTIIEKTENRVNPTIDMSDLL